MRNFDVQRDILVTIDSPNLEAASNLFGRLGSAPANNSSIQQDSHVSWTTDRVKERLGNTERGK